MKKSDVLKNAKWIVGCKIVQSLLQLVIGMLTARYLGPSNYGLISYASSLVAFVVPVMQLGLRSTLVQEYVNHPEEEGKILGTTLVLNGIAAVACMLGVVSFAAVANPGEKETILVCLLYSTSLFFQAIEMVQYWFQAKLLSRYPSVLMLCAYFIVAGYRIFLLARQKSVIWFAVSHSIEYGIVGVALLLCFYKLSGQKPGFSMSLAKRMISKSRYYIVAGMMVTIFQNTDHVMLKLMVGDAENGFYTTAVTCAGMTQFVYLAIIDSARPMIIASKGIDNARFERELASLYSLILYLALAQAVCFTILAGPIIWCLYGSEYFAAVPVLRIVVWYVAFSCLGTIRNIWILAEGKHSILWIINLSGALFNVALNAVLIPYMGACGAALASVLTQLFTNFVMGFIMKPIRANNRLILRGLDPRMAIAFVKK